ncbi:efflux RND transporter permease subunit [Sagittula salina]|uniref:Efflux RND transporter permease subunit n=1 Tax=Sagittula salina TaxID=2820268 RepID=A0A940MMW0_9RHOB|nr:efflux RND transporter permease subunit [Sagittula salina]MBP0482640.1 efflux RND transporter permease subunit [Sagittula salina]
MARDVTKVGGLLSYFTRHPTVSNLIFVILLAAGLLAVPNMRAQFFPDVIVDDLSVSVSWDGAGAEDVDAAIVQVLEPALLAVEGVESSESSSREGRASIDLTFEPGWDMGRAADEVQQAVDSASGLPEEADAPSVRRGGWRDRVTDVVITGPVGVDQLARFADEFVARLFADGVTRTTIQGIAAPRVVVEVPTATLIEHDVTMAEIAAAIAAEVDADPAGEVDGAGARVRTGVEKRSAEDIAEISLRARADGTKLTVGDVARVREEGVDRERGYFVGPNAAISVRVDRSDKGDAIAIQKQVEEVAADYQASLPEGVTIDLIRTRSEAITGRLNLLTDNALMGLVLVVGLLFLFLNTKTAFWVAAGIPTSLLAAIALMYVGGLTINMISLFALIITLGIVVDDAIVVGEHADSLARRGLGPFEAAERSAQRMALPVFSATLTTVIAFFGLTAISGRFGDMIADIPFTVITVLIASLVECFFILPSHMAHALKPRGAAGFRAWRAGLGLIGEALVGMLAVVLAVLALLSLPGALNGTWATFGDSPAWVAGLHDRAIEARGWLLGLGWQGALGLAVAVVGALLLRLRGMAPERRTAELTALSDMGIDSASRTVNRGFRALREGLFRPVMALVIRARYVVLAAAVLALASVAVLFIDGAVQWRFFNSPERGSVTGNFAMAPGAKRADTLEQTRLLQQTTDELGREYEDRYGLNPLAYVMAEIGGNSGRGLAGADTKDADQLGGISIELIEADLRPYSSFAFVGELQDRVKKHPLVEEISFRGWRSGPGGDALDVQFYGADAGTLKAAAEDLKAAVAQFPEVSAVEDNLSYDKAELILELTPQGQALGFDIDGLGRVLRNRLGGIEAASYPVGARSATIRVELPPGELTADFLERMMLRTPGGEYVALADIVRVETRSGFSTVRRENGIRLISVTGDISEDDPARATEIMTALEQAILPRIANTRQVDWRMSGLSEQEDRFLDDAKLGLMMVLLGIYLVLSWVFASWTRPLVVMAIIPFGLVGAIFGHWLWEIPASMFTVVGLLGMTGIIINDSIVLVTQIDEYGRDRGLIPAIIDGAADRLRAVFLTTATTVLGLAPLLYERSADAQFLKPTVVTLVYGLGFGMVLVLLVVPSLVAVQHDVGQAWGALKKGWRFRTAPVRAMLVGGTLAAVGWLAVTLGWVAVAGRLPAALGGGEEAAALGLFLAGALVLVLVLYAVAAVSVALGRRAGHSRAPR